MVEKETTIHWLGIFLRSSSARLCPFVSSTSRILNKNVTSAAGKRSAVSKSSWRTSPLILFFLKMSFRREQSFSVNSVAMYVPLKGFIKE